MANSQTLFLKKSRCHKLTEDSVKMMSDFVDRIVEWKASDTAPTAY